MEVNLAIEALYMTMLAGKVFDQPNFSVPGARIQAFSPDFRRYDTWRSTTDQDVQFQVERYPEASYLHFINPSSDQGTIVEISEDDSKVATQLSNRGQAASRLISEDSSQPASGFKWHSGVRLCDLQ